MFKFQMTGRLFGPTFALSEQGDQRVRAVFVEHPSFDPAAGAALARIVHSAAASVAAEPPDSWSIALARALHGLLVASHPPEPSNALFAALVLTPDRVHVCTAGDLRVHLVVDDELAQVTGDHVQALDPLASPRVGLDPVLAATVSTRWLGTTCDLPPAAHSWAASPPYTVAIASSAYHHWRSPSGYGVPELRVDLEADVARTQGILVAIEVSQS